MDDRNFQNDFQENKDKTKTVWKHIGLIGVSLVLAIVTVFFLSLNR